MMPLTHHRMILAVLLIVLFSTATSKAAAGRPNILLAISDDQSFPYAGAYGDKALNTPAFDRIAREGVLFQNAFCASPGCSPSRAALLTGRHTWQIEQAGTHACPSRCKRLCTASARPSPRKTHHTNCPIAVLDNGTDHPSEPSPIGFLAPAATGRAARWLLGQAWQED